MIWNVDDDGDDNYDDISNKNNVFGDDNDDDRDVSSHFLLWGVFWLFDKLLLPERRSQKNCGQLFCSMADFLTNFSCNFKILRVWYPTPPINTTQDDDDADDDEDDNDDDNNDDDNNDVSNGDSYDDYYSNNLSG